MTGGAAGGGEGDGSPVSSLQELLLVGTWPAGWDVSTQLLIAFVCARCGWPGGMCGGRGPFKTPSREEYWSESLLWAVFPYKGLFLPLVLNRIAFSGRPCGPAHSASYYVRPARGEVPPPDGLPPRRSASRLAPPWPGGPRFARRCAPRPRWSRLPGGGGRGASDLRPARTRGPSAGLGSTAGTG
jgi:hypothetical protein